MTCATCGALLPEVGQFCPECGTARPDEQPARPSILDTPTTTIPAPAASATPSPGPPPTAPPGSPPTAPPAPPASPPTAPPAAPGDGSGSAHPGMPTLVKVGIALVTLVVLGGVAWAVVAGRSSSGTGAASPDEAVEALAAALAEDDMVGVMEALDPDEVGPLAELADLILRRAGELELVTVTDRGLADLSLDVEGLELSVEELHPDVARVTIERGELSADFTSPAPDLVLATDGEVVTYDTEELSGRVDLDDAYHDIEDGPRETFVMAVRRDGGWYVSPLYTAAEVIRQSTDLDEPDFDASRGENGGADSPVAAVEAFASALADLDPETGVLALPPGEWGFAHDYLDALMEEVDQDELEDTRRDLDLALDDMELVEGEDLGGGRRSVEIRSLELEWSDEYDGETRVSVEGRCAEVTTEDDSDEASGQGCLEDWLADGGYDPILAALLPEQPYVVTVEDGGGWYVSPMETLAAYLREAVERMDRDHLDAMGLVEPRALEVGEVTEDELATPFRRAAYDFELEDGEVYLLGIEATDHAGDLSVHPRGGSSYGAGAAWVPSDRDLPFTVVQAEAEEYMAVVEADTWDLDEDDRGDAVPFTVEVRPLESEGELALDETVEIDLDEGQLVAYTFESDGDLSFVPELEGDAAGRVHLSLRLGSLGRARHPGRPLLGGHLRGPHRRDLTGFGPVRHGVNSGHRRSPRRRPTGGPAAARPTRVARGSSGAGGGNARRRRGRRGRDRRPRGGRHRWIPDRDGICHQRRLRSGHRGLRRELRPGGAELGGSLLAAGRGRLRGRGRCGLRRVGRGIQRDRRRRCGRVGGGLDQG